MNVFLTGEINCGKTTIIDEFLSDYKGKIVGFKTVKEKTHLDDYYGIYMLNINDTNQKFTSVNKVGECNKDKSLICYKDVFEKLGINALKDYKSSDMIIMDELGVLENKCELFQQIVHMCLDSNVNMLGVIKQRNSSFLDNIRNRKDVNIIEVSKANNIAVLNTLKDLF